VALKTGSVFAMLADEQLILHPQLIFMLTGRRLPASWRGGNQAMLLMLNMIVGFHSQILQGMNVKNLTKA
jgi:hypothetical protein